MGDNDVLHADNAHILNPCEKFTVFSIIAVTKGVERNGVAIKNESFFPSFYLV